MISSSANIIIKLYYFNEYPKHQLTEGKKHLIESINDPRQHYKQAPHKKTLKTNRNSHIVKKIETKSKIYSLCAPSIKH